MPGAQLQLVSQGRQDLFLIGNPQMTYWKQIYRRYTNFAVESIGIVFDGGANFSKRLTAVIPHTGDLLSRLYLEVQVPIPYTGSTYDVSWVNSLGHVLIEEVSIEIDNKEYDKHTGEFMEAWSHLTVSSSKRLGFNTMIGRVGAFNETSMPGALTLHIPLYFWFCRNPGTALPLVAMQSSTVRVNLKLRSFAELRYTPLMATQANASLAIPAVNMTSCIMWANYVFLGVEERRRFVSNPHEYLIEQVQNVLNNPITATNPVANIPLNIHHPVSEIIWLVRQDRMLETNELFNYGNVRIDETGESTDLFTSAIIRLDGFERFKERVATYFRLVQPYESHTCIPEETYVYVYSMSLKPEEAQPSGSCNMSRFTNKVLSLTMNQLGGQQRACTANVYARNYNILRIVDGQCGLLFYV